MSDYEAVVYDLDGTLVSLDVDWAAVTRDAAAALEERGINPPDDLWGMLELDDADAAASVEQIIANHEKAGARTATRLPAADRLPHRVPVAVCSLNCEAACRAALDVHNLAEHVAAVVGRDSMSAHKPDPKPLLAAAEALRVAPADAVFIGDSPRDEETANRAGMPFRYVSDWLHA